MLGLDGVVWTAIATTVLAVVTLVYVVLTWRIARSAGRSAAASERSAKSAEMAAEATSRAATIAEAGLDVGFEVDYSQTTQKDFELLTLQLKSSGATVFVHSAVVSGAIIKPLQGEPDIVSGELQVSPNKELPMRLHRGELAVFKWPFGALDLEAPMGGVVRIEYSIDGNPPTKTFDALWLHREEKKKGGKVWGAL